MDPSGPYVRYGKLSVSAPWAYQFIHGGAEASGQSYYIPLTPIVVAKLDNANQLLYMSMP